VGVMRCSWLLHCMSSGGNDNIDNVKVIAIQMQRYLNELKKKKYFCGYNVPVALITQAGIRQNASVNEIKQNSSVSGIKWEGLEAELICQ